MATTSAERSVAARGAMAPLPYVVARKRRETRDVWTLELEPVDEAIEQIRPGQFTMLYRFGVGEAPISSSGDPELGFRLVHTMREAGQVTRGLCAAKPGDLVGVRGPFGNAWPVDTARGKDVVFVAGGIGLPPLRGAVYDVLAHRNGFGRVVLLYGGRSPGELVFRSDVERWRSRLDVDVEVTVDTAGHDWRGNVGVVTKLIPRAPFDPANAVAFVVGPEIMMRFAAAALIERGLPQESLWISMERTMRCGVGLCGHCQLGPTLICRDGPVYRWDEMRPWLEVAAL
ncbi:MAG: FAD/NAD(P)-binding protein [Actinobacteria bacterium]|nr:FAD/NAD(P)-binding protein [Actinomycetota bacterium]